MKGFLLYTCHQALMLHFGNGNYDYFKYHGKTRLTEDSFKKSPFRWQYAKLEDKTEHVLWHMWCVFKQNDFSYVTPKALFYQSRTNEITTHPSEYLTTTVAEDLDHLRDTYNGTTDYYNIDGLYPAIYNDFKSGEITLETLLLIDQHISPVFETGASPDIITWPQVLTYMSKLSPFVHELFDRQSFLDLFTDRYLR